MKKMLKSAFMIFTLALMLGVVKVNAITMDIDRFKEIATIEIAEGETDELDIYVFGKYVYMSEIYLRDIYEVAASGTVTEAMMYYRDAENDVWRETINYSEVDLSDRTFEMIRLIGSKNMYVEDEGYVHVSADATLYEDESVYLGTEESIDTRIREIFDDETISLTIVNVKPVNAIDLGSNEEINGIHKYNTGALEVNYSNNKLTLNEKTPLLSYKNTSAEGRWFGLLVETSKPITTENKDTITIKLINGSKTYTYGIEDIDITDAENHGAGVNEFVMWFRAEEVASNSTLTVTDGNNTQTIGIEYKELATKFVYEDAEAEPTVKTAGVNVAKAEINGETVYIFYSEEEVTTIEFTENKVEKVAIKENDEWNVYSKLTFDVNNSVKPGAVVDVDVESAKHKTNQTAIQNGIEVKEAENGIYDVTITSTEYLQSYKNNFDKNNAYAWLSFVIDLGINPEDVLLDGQAVDYKDAARHGAGENGFVEWLGFKADAKTSSITVTYTNANVPGDEITIRFTLVYDVTPLVITNVKPVNAIDLGSNEEINGIHKYNTGALEVNYSNNKLTLNEKTPLLSYKNTSAEGRWFGLLVETSKPITTENKDNYVITLTNGDKTYTYGIEDIDITDAENHGAGVNEFVMWFRAEEVGPESTLSIKESSIETQVVEIEYKELATKFVYEDAEAEPTVKTAGVNVAKVEINGETVYVFYSEKEVTTIEFTENKVEKVAIKENDEWNVYSKLTFDVNNSVKPGAVVDIDVESAKHKTNQTAIQDAVEVTKVDDSTYDVTITSTEYLQSYKNNFDGEIAHAWLSFVIDLGIDPKDILLDGQAVDYKDAARHGAGENGFVEWLGFGTKAAREGSQTITVTYTNANVPGDELTIRFTLVYDVTPLVITNVRLVNPIKLGTNNEINDIHAYNMSALDINTRLDNAFKLIEKTPLLSYKNTSAEGRWFGLLVETSKPITTENKDNYVITLTNGDKTYTYGIEDIDITDAENHGAGVNEFVMWFRAEEVGPESTLSIKEGSVETQVIRVYYEELATKFVYEDAEAEPIVKTAGVNVTKVEINGETVYIFYSEEEVTVIEFTEGALNKKATYVDGEWIVETIYPEFELNTVKPGSPVEIDIESDKHVTNQTAIQEGVVVTESTEDGIDYDVTITSTKLLEAYKNNFDKENDYIWLSFVIDLGIDPKDILLDGQSVDYKDAARHGAGENGFVEWLGFKADAKTSSITVTYTNANVPENTMTIKFTLVIDITPMEFNGKLANSDVEMIPGATAKEDINKNTLYQQNMSALTYSENVEEDNVKTITIKATDVLNSWVAGNNVNAKHFAIIANLGVDPTLLSSAQYKIEEEDMILENVKHFAGESYEENDFVMWLDTTIDGKSITFTNTESTETITIKFVVIEVVTVPFNKTGFEYSANNAVKVLTDNVRFDKTSKQFVLDNSIDKFLVDIDGDEWTFAKNADGEWTAVKSLKLNSAVASSKTVSTEQDFNNKHAKIASIENNKIEVVFDAELYTIPGHKKLYGIVLDLGVDSSKLSAVLEDGHGYVIETTDYSDSCSHLSDETAKAKCLEKNTYVVIWLDEELTSVEGGYTIPFIQEGSDEILEVTIHSSYDFSNTPVLEFNGAVAVDPNNSKVSAEHKKLNHNLKSIEVISNTDNAEVIINYYRKLQDYPANGHKLSYFPVIIDLGMDINEISTVGGYTINDIDKTDSMAWGATSNTELLLWLDVQAFKIDSEGNGTYTITFTNTSEENPNNKLTVTFKLVNCIDDIKDRTLSATDLVTMPDGVNEEFFNINQNAYTREVSDNDITLTLNVNKRELGIYERSGKSAAWYGIVLDLGVETSLLSFSENSSYEIEKLEGTEFILWIDLNVPTHSIEVKHTFNNTVKNINVTVK